MRVEVRLYATFVQYAPTRRAGDAFDVQLEDTSTVIDLIRKLGIPAAEVHLAIVNGRIVHDRLLRVSEADRIGLFPPVGGG